MEMEKQIQHPFHRQHPLVLVEEQSNENDKASCSVCGELVSGSNFSCLDCNYHLHKEYPQAPFTVHNHPVHPPYSAGLFLLESLSTYPKYACALCKENRNMLFYKCDDCHFVLDIKCALSSHKVDESTIYEFKDNGHQQPFIFLKNIKDELKKNYCSWCHESLTDSIYVSIDHKAYLHRKCFNELPAEIIDHPCHRLLTLILRFDKINCFCKVNQKKNDYNFFNRCFACKFNIQHECIWPGPTIENKRHHEHPFNLFFKDAFICDACGTNGKFVSYICPTCHLQIHESCISLPRIIKVTRHDHNIFHKYFFRKRAFEKYDCKICFEEVKTEHGSYHCLKEVCNYIVHVKCATDDDNLYYIIDQDEELNETNKAMDSSITCVSEVNEQGEAIKIKHFSHRHNLVFEDKIQEDNDRHCDGCMQSISTAFYHCSECNFFLHKTCAELPKIKHHWFDRFAATLEVRNWFWCYLCRRLCSGLLYRSSSLHFCLRCAIVPNTIEGQRHEHFLFFDYKCKEQCNACGVGSSYGAFRCKNCINFTLDLACMTLPEAIQHRCDIHLLKLTYHDESDEHYCDICEENRDPNYWYYYCSTCDNSIHPKCVLGEYPFVKKGGTWPWPTKHVHDVIYVRKVDGYPKCTVCGKLCQDEALKCSSCHKFAHFECRYKDW